MAWIDGFLPTTLFTPFLLYSFFSHEVAEWARERDQGLQGSSASFGSFVDLTATVGQFGLYVLLAAYLYDEGWKRTIGLYVITFAIGTVLQFFPLLIKRSSEQAFMVFRLACLAVLYMSLIYICFHLSWFGVWASSSAPKA